MIEKLEVKRQVLKKRAEQTKADSDNEINWDDDDDDLETVEEIPGDKIINIEMVYCYNDFVVVLERNDESKFYWDLSYV